MRDHGVLHNRKPRIINTRKQRLFRSHLHAALLTHRPSLAHQVRVVFALRPETGEGSVDFVEHGNSEGPKRVKDGTVVRQRVAQDWRVFAEDLLKDLLKDLESRHSNGWSGTPGRNKERVVHHGKI